jgi:hypothetical protein
MFKAPTAEKAGIIRRWRGSIKLGVRRDSQRWIREHDIDVLPSALLKRGGR